MANLSSFPLLYSVANQLKLISDSDREIYDFVNYIGFSNTISIFGLVANVMNMVVFYKQGFTSSMNISFFGLAIADLFRLITMLFLVVYFSPLFVECGIPVVGEEALHLTAGIPHVYFGRVSAWITVYITAERCLSIMVPLKIKLIITPTRTTVTLCLIYLVMFLVFLPEYITSYMDWKFYPERNKTLLGLVFTKDRESAEGLTYILYTFMGYASFVGVVLFTSVLIIQLKQKSKWRMQATEDKNKPGSISTKEKKTVLMVVMIAMILIVCYMPGAVVSLVTVFEPSIGIARINVNVYFVLWSFVGIFDVLNSSVNIFLYYRMSSKYRETFDLVFCDFEQKVSGDHCCVKAGAAQR